MKIAIRAKICTTQPTRSGSARRRIAAIYAGPLGGREFAYEGRLRLWANGLAFSRSAIRTGVPGNSKYSRSEFTR